MLEIVPYERELLFGFEYNGIEKGLSGSQINAIVEFYATLGRVFVGLVDGKVIGVGGVYPLWKNAGSVFLFLNREASKYKVSIFKSLLDYIPMLIKEYDIKTLMVNCIDDIQAKTLITHLGFRKSKEIKMGLYYLGGL